MITTEALLLLFFCYFFVAVFVVVVVVVFDKLLQIVKNHSKFHFQMKCRSRVNTWPVVNEGKFRRWQKIEPTENRRPTKKTRVICKTDSSETESRLERIRIAFLNIKQDVRLKFTNVLFTTLFQRIKGNQSDQILEIWSYSLNNFLIILWKVFLFLSSYF